MFKIILTLYLATSGVNAQELNLTDLPPLKPTKLFVSKLDPQLHLLLGKDEDTDLFYILINNGKKIFAPKRSSYPVAQSHEIEDFYMESGERVLIPLSSTVNEMGLNTGALYIHQDRSPTPLREIAISSTELRQLGFSKFISLSPIRRKSEPYKNIKNPQILQNPEDKIIVTIQINDTIHKSMFKMIEQGLDKIAPSEIRILETQGQSSYSQNHIMLLAPANAIKAIRSEIPSDYLISFETFDIKPISAQQTSSSTVSSILKYSQSEPSLQNRFETMRSLHNNPSALYGWSESEKTVLVEMIKSTLIELDHLYSTLQTFTKYETKLKDFKSGKRTVRYSYDSLNNTRRSEGHPLNTHLLEPLRKETVLLYSLLDKIGTSSAREAALETMGLLRGAGLYLIQTRPTGLSHSYFKEWLNIKRSHFSTVDLLPEPAQFSDLENLELEILFSKDEQLENLGLSSQMVNLRSEFESTEIPVITPVILFGLPGDKEALRREFIQYIIDADKYAHKLTTWVKKAQRNSASITSEKAHAIVADRDMHRLLQEMIHPPEADKFILTKFSEPEYYLNVIGIFQQLLTIADTTIVDSGTYVSLLEASLGALKQIDQRYGLNNKRFVRLSQAASQLQNLIQQKILRGIHVFSQEPGNSRACEIMLSPNPWRTLKQI